MSQALDTEIDQDCSENSARIAVELDNKQEKNIYYQLVEMKFKL